VLMATNRPDTLDPALLRPGRLDRKVEFALPDLEGRAHILKIHTKVRSLPSWSRLCVLRGGISTCCGGGGGGRGGSVTISHFRTKGDLPLLSFPVPACLATTYVLWDSLTSDPSKPSGFPSEGRERPRARLTPPALSPLPDCTKTSIVSLPSSLPPFSFPAGHECGPRHPL
jgi:hypothetical protein